MKGIGIPAPGTIFNHNWDGKYKDENPRIWPNVPRHGNKLPLTDARAGTNSGSGNIKHHNQVERAKEDYICPQSGEYDFYEAVINALSEGSHTEIMKRLCGCDCKCAGFEFIVWIEESDETELTIADWQKISLLSPD